MKLQLVIRPVIDIVTTPWQPRADIPNQHDYKLLIKHANGLEYQTSVVKGKDGLHRLADICITDVQGWIPLSRFIPLSS